MGRKSPEHDVVVESKPGVGGGGGRALETSWLAPAHSTPTSGLLWGSSNWGVGADWKGSPGSYHPTSRAVI